MQLTQRTDNTDNLQTALSVRENRMFISIYIYIQTYIHTYTHTYEPVIKDRCGVVGKWVGGCVLSVCLYFGLKPA